MSKTVTEIIEELITCPICGSHDYVVHHVVMTNISTYTCNDCDWFEQRLVPSSPTGRTAVAKPVIQNVAPKKPLEECTEKELGEILVAVELLMEYPVVEKYIKKLREDLAQAMGTKKYLGCTQCQKPMLVCCDKWRDEHGIMQTTYSCQCGAKMFVTLWAGSPNVIEMPEGVA